MANQLQGLLEAGRLLVGDRLYHPRRGEKGKEIEAVVTADGLEVAGRIFRSLSTAAGAVAGYSANGWMYWRLRRTGQTVGSLRG